MKEVREQLKGGRSVNKFVYLLRISKLPPDVEHLAGLVVSIDLQLPKRSGLVEEASRSREELFKTKRDKDRQTAENMIVIAQYTEMP